jgi:hypothetical protein
VQERLQIVAALPKLDRWIPGIADVGQQAQIRFSDVPDVRGRLPGAGAAAAIGQKGRFVSVAETLADLTEVQNQTKNSNDYWSEWQDLNLRPLRPERSALPD